MFEANIFRHLWNYFFPETAVEIDWNQEYHLMDKELRQITREAEIGFRLVDRLKYVYKQNGDEKLND